MAASSSLILRPTRESSKHVILYVISITFILQGSYSDVGQCLLGWGERALEALMQKHEEVCQKSWICSALNLQTLLAEGTSDVDEGPSTPKKKNQPLRLMPIQAKPQHF